MVQGDSTEFKICNHHINKLVLGEMAHLGENDSWDTDPVDRLERVRGENGHVPFIWTKGLQWKYKCENESVKMKVWKWKMAGRTVTSLWSEL